MRNFPGVIYCFWHHVGLEFFMLRVKLRIESSICLVKSIFYNLHGKVVNVSQESHSFKSCPKAEIDCVENKKTFFNAVSKFVSELVKYWVEKSQRRGREGTRWALTSFQFCKNGKVSFENTYKTTFWYMSESTSSYTLKLLPLYHSFCTKNKGILML